MISIIFLGIDGIHLLESVTVISPMCSSPAKVKSVTDHEEIEQKNPPKDLLG